MDRNICEDGTSATESNKCLVDWVIEADYNGDEYYFKGEIDEGPITAMNYLHNATKKWDNLTNIIINYTNSTETDEAGYRAITTTPTETGTTTVITKKDGTITASYENLKARLPYSSDVSDYSASLGNQYLYDNLYLSCYDLYEDEATDEIIITEQSCDVAENVEGLNVAGISHISEIYGYWLSSTNEKYSGYMYHEGNIRYGWPINGLVGVRPVIILEI